MEGSIFSILPLLSLIFLGLPAMVPNFPGKVQLVWEKLVGIWDCLENSIRFGWSLLDFFFSTPVVQQPVFLIGGSWATTYLVNLGIKSLTAFWGSTLIFEGINYLSIYIFLLLVQISFIYNKKFMGNIRGKKSGNRPQRDNWVFTPLDFAFMLAGNGILCFSPILEWGLKSLTGAFSTSPGWEKFWVGYCCWIFIFIFLRLTIFLPEQRPKFKLLLMAILLVFLSINIEDVPTGSPGLGPAQSQIRMAREELSLGPCWTRNSTQSLEMVRVKSEYITTRQNHPFQDSRILEKILFMGLSQVNKPFREKIIQVPNRASKKLHHLSRRHCSLKNLRIAKQIHSRRTQWLTVETSTIQTKAIRNQGTNQAHQLIFAERKMYEILCEFMALRMEMMVLRTLTRITNTVSTEGHQEMVTCDAGWEQERRRAAEWQGAIQLIDTAELTHKGYGRLGGTTTPHTRGKHN